MSGLVLLLQGGVSFSGSGLSVIIGCQDLSKDPVMPASCCDLDDGG